MADSTPATLDAPPVFQPDRKIGATLIMQGQLVRKIGSIVSTIITSVFKPKPSTPWDGYRRSERGRPEIELFPWHGWRYDVRDEMTDESRN